MMDVRELRIGNLVCRKGSDTPIAVKSIYQEDVIWGVNVNFNEHDHTRAITYNPPDWNMQPIPLTEEWLAKFGFERGSLDMFRVYYHNGKVGFSWERHGQYVAFPFTYYCASLPENSAPVKLLYVHQLQNLYYALTGKELEIK